MGGSKQQSNSETHSGYLCPCEPAEAAANETVSSSFSEVHFTGYDLRMDPRSREAQVFTAWNNTCEL